MPAINCARVEELIVRSDVPALTVPVNDLTAYAPDASVTVIEKP